MNKEQKSSSNNFVIEKQLWDFVGDPFLLPPFKTLTNPFSLKNMITMMWYMFRTDDKTMKNLYPKNIDIALRYIETENINTKVEKESIVYKAFEKICLKFMADQPRCYVTIHFVHDFEFVAVIKRQDEFEIVAGTFVKKSGTSDIFKSRSFKDSEEAQDCFFVFVKAMSYDAIDSTDVIKI